ncbi:MAG: Hemolysin III-like protein [Candidatus Peribacteria bacterium GW2011_GWC2_54_8]|nr:MAG: Hemolysin III-like protein [Candidatus Peribacteria bacterium GW2011_GWC2_54_8]KKW44194.1 MAG: Hemolysin III-like protein [Candidatus Peregrinibacteria bacterium GW2011_GWA2_54_9]
MVCRCRTGYTAVMVQKKHSTRSVEEVANSTTHAVGFVLGVAVLVILVVHASHAGDVWKVVSASIYGATLVCLYLASTLAHAFSFTRARHSLRRIDRTAIYFLIAGTYTPFTLVAFRGGWGWSIFGTIWGLACVGVILEVFSSRMSVQSPWILYLLMGWLVVVAIVPIVQHLPLAGVLLLAAGGLAYSLGILFYINTKPFRHMLWHLSVLMGSALHFLVVFQILA